ncbi:MAG: double zinc ribbon domain-containing protein [Eubacteriales bacterium]
MSAAFSALMRAVFPPLCVFCGDLADENGIFCPHCTMRWENETHLLCPVCGKSEMLCRCVPAGAVGAVSSAYRLAPYYPGRRTAAAALIYALKDRGERRAVDYAARAIAHQLISDGVGSDIIVTNAPRRADKIRSRGFDQSELLARAAAKLIGAKYVRTMKSSAKTDQKGLSAAERVKNAEDSYSLTASARGKIAGRDILLVDDILTSGATTRACAGILYAAGARDIRGVYIAVSSGEG